MMYSEKELSAKKKQILSVSYQSDVDRLEDKNDVEDFYTLKKLEALLVKRCSTKSLFISCKDSESTEDVFEQNGLAAPFIVRQLKDHNSVSYKVVCEGVNFKATKKAKKAALMLIAVYYTFNIKYPTLLSAVLIFLQHSIFNIPEKKLPISVVHLNSSLMKLLLEQ